MPVITSASAYSAIAKEATPGAAVTSYPGTFGLADSITSISTSENVSALYQAGKRGIQTRAFGRRSRSFGASWVLSAPWFFELLFGKGSHTANTTPTPHTHTYEIERIVQTFAMKLGYDLGTTDYNRELVACVLQSATISGSVTGQDDTIKCSGQITAGGEKEYSTESARTTARDTAVDLSTIPSDAIDYPYTSPDTTISLGSTAIEKIQSFDVTFAMANAILYGVGEKNAQDGSVGQANFSGNLSLPFEDKTYVEKVIGRAQETDSLTILFDNGKTGADQKSISCVFSGVNFNSVNYGHSINERIDQGLTWDAKGCIVTASNNEDAPKL